MSTIDANNIQTDLMDKIDYTAGLFDIKLEFTTIGSRLNDLIKKMYDKFGQIIVLIDEYDKPILDSISNLELATKVRDTLRLFYIVFKSCDQYIRFMFVTGISKFSKTGVFSVMNNLEDISFDKNYSDLVGYTQQELEDNFLEYIDNNAKSLKMTTAEYIAKLKDYYDGFSFDGDIKVYNPFSIMQCLKKNIFFNYWYDSGSSNFIVHYMKKHNIDDPKNYDHLIVSDNFTSSQEIESARPESFLYQAGYLTIEKRFTDSLILTYPNYEVRHSILRMYLEHIYNIGEYRTLGADIWNAISSGNIDKVVNLYNIALSRIPYDDFPNRDEGWYRSLFLMLLQGSVIDVLAEVHSNKGRSDIIILHPNRIVIFEFKCAKTSKGVPGARKKGEEQIITQNYNKQYEHDTRPLTKAVLIINLQKREIVL